MNTRSFINSESFVSAMPNDLVIETRAPRFAPDSDDSLESQAARLLLLLRYAGGRKGAIIGRTKLAKLDFFLRYPNYLEKALGLARTTSHNVRPESPMIRYKYGPWDERYYDVFALLVARGLVKITPTPQGDEFALTDRGYLATYELENTDDFDELIDRCKTINGHFKNKTGTYLKNFIYENFPEIVAKPLGTKIDS